MSEQEPPIDPAVQAAADKVRRAYENLQNAQDPLVKEAARRELDEALAEATIITLASELKHDSHPKPKSRPN